jgi:hypothetical protein
MTRRAATLNTFDVTSMIRIRRAAASDARKFGAVFARERMFPPAEWATLVVDHAPPNVLLVAVDARGNVVGFIAAHPQDDEMFLLFVHSEHAGHGLAVSTSRDPLPGQGERGKRERSQTLRIGWHQHLRGPANG